MASELENSNYTAKLAITLLQKYSIPPVPENYAVWYTYALAKNKEMIREVDSIVNNGLSFTQETCSYLHNKYILGNRNQKVLDDTALSAQKVLMEVLKVIKEFGSETQSYSKNVDEYIEHISELGDSSVKDIVKDLIEATAGLKQRGENIHQKLEESTKEISSLKQNLQQVTIEAQRDFLTGVFNRKTFEKSIDELMLGIKSEGKGDLCLMMIDIDHFKHFNDKFGHLLGDEVLKTVARTLTDTLKGRDVVARFGGEEFVVVLPDTPLDGAMKVADMIRAAIAGKELKRKDTGETYGTITVSMGVARYRPETDSLPTLIKRADDALYKSKNNGRNQVTREA